MTARIDGLSRKPIARKTFGIFMSACLVLASVPAQALAEGIEELAAPECVCEALCTEDDMNEECPVCSTEGATVEDCEGEPPAEPEPALEPAPEPEPAPVANAAPLADIAADVPVANDMPAEEPAPVANDMAEPVADVAVVEAEPVVEMTPEQEPAAEAAQPADDVQPADEVEETPDQQAEGIPSEAVENDEEPATEGASEESAAAAEVPAGLQPLPILRAPAKGSKELKRGNIYNNRTLANGGYYLGGDISGISCAFTVEGNVTLDLNGHTFSCGTHIFNLQPGAVMTLVDRSAAGTGKITGSHNSGETDVGGAFTVPAGATLNMQSGTIENCQADCGGGVNVAGTFNMYGGTITGCSSYEGSAVFCNGGTFNMYGGIIKNSMRHGGAEGSAVEIMPGGTVRMSGGTIAGGGNVAETVEEYYGADPASVHFIANGGQVEGIVDLVAPVERTASGYATFTGNVTCKGSETGATEKSGIAVRYDTDGDGTYDTVRYVLKGQKVLQVAAARDGYTFKSWVDGDSGKVVDLESARVTTAMSLKPTWLRNTTDAAIKPFNPSYSGSEQSIAVDVSIPGSGGETVHLDRGKDFTLSGKTSATEVGTYSATINFTDEYAGKQDFTWQITPKQIGACVIDLDRTFYYDGKEKSPRVTVKNGSLTLQEGVDYVLGGATKAVDAGSYTLAVTGMGENYAGTTNVTWHIAQQDLSDCAVSLDASSYTYDGTVKAPMVTVSRGSKTLAAGEDYELDGYLSAIDAGAYAIKVTGIGTVGGEKTATWTIKKAKPSYTVPVGLTIGYRTALSVVQLPEGWSWKNASYSPVMDVPGTVKSYDATFTPSDTRNYETVTAQVPVTVVKSNQVITGGSTTTLVLGMENPSVARGSGTGLLSYELKSGGDVLDLNTQNGDVTLKKRGEAVVTIKSDGNEYYKDTSRDITVTVKGEQQTLAPVKQYLTVTYGDTSQKLAVTGVKTKVTYETKSDLIKVNEDTGAITPLKAGGTTGAYVTATAAGNDQTDPAETYFYVYVEKAASTCTAPTPVSGLTYDGTAQELVSAGSTSDGTMVYSLDQGDEKAWETDIPTAADAGAYTVYYKVQGDENHKDSPVGSVQAGIAKRNIAGSVVMRGEDPVYDGTEKAAVIESVRTDEGILLGEDDYTVSGETKATDAGSHAITVEGTGSCEGSVSASWEITRANLSDVSVAQVGELTHTGNPQTAQVEARATSVGGQPVTFRYKADEYGEYGDEVPAFTDAGTHPVRFLASAPNHISTEGAFDVVIQAQPTVTWDANGGTVDTDGATTTAPRGTAIVAPSADKVTRDSTAERDYAFAGWYTASEGGEPLATGATLQDDVTYYAHWTESPREYAVSFDSDGGTKVASQSVEYGAKASRPDDPVRDGYVFEGWYAVQDGQMAADPYDFGTTVTGDASLRAAWDEIVTWEIPFTTTIALGGTTQPEQTLFELEVLTADEYAAEHSIVSLMAAPINGLSSGAQRPSGSGSVTTGDAGSYQGILTVTGASKQTLNDHPTLYVRQVPGNDARWQYSDAVWCVVLAEPSGEGAPGAAEIARVDAAEPVEVGSGMTFENVHTAYTVTYTDGANGEAFADDVHAGLAKDSKTPAFAGGTPKRDGYIFKGWSSKIADTVTEDATYVAQWEKEPVKDPREPADPGATTPGGGQGGQGGSGASASQGEGGNAGGTRQGSGGTAGNGAMSGRAGGARATAGTASSNGGSPAARIPQTGDDYQPGAMLALAACGLAAVGAGIHCRKKERGGES